MIKSIRDGLSARRIIVSAAVLVFLLLFLAACRDGSEAPAAGSGDDQQGDPAAPGVVQGGEEDPADAGDSQPDGAEAAPAATSVPTATPRPAKSLTVCIPGSARDVYLYGDTSPAAQALRHALFENLYTRAGYQYQAQGLEKLPSLTDGDARREVIAVEEGDRVVDLHGNVRSLRKGVTIVNADGDAIEYDDEPVDMERLVVDFKFRPLVWSDGTEVSAADSVFSFNVAADPATSNAKAKVGTTESYVALDDQTVRWTGLPGYLDTTYFTNVWAPLPSHVLNEYTAVDLLEREEATTMPLSSGPYVIREWDGSDGLVLEANPFYYRASDGLPRIDEIVVRFNVSANAAPDSISECDVLADDALSPQSLLQESLPAELADWDVLTAPGNVYEQVVFGVVPVSEYREGRPDWFGDARVRQAIALCTDRRRMADELTGGYGEVLNTLAPEGHPLVPEDLAEWIYDPEAANALLDEAGYLDYAGDGRRQDVASGVPMTITLGTNSESTLRLRINEMFQENMAECDIPVTLYDRQAGTWFGDGPGGPLFGRKFDLAEFAWLGHAIPDCGVFHSENISGPESAGFAGWRGSNVSGWTNEAYDAACGAARRALPGGEGFQENLQEAMRIFNQELPALPLFTNFKVAAVRPNVLNVQLEAMQPSLLWNIAEWDVGDE